MRKHNFEVFRRVLSEKGGVDIVGSDIAFNILDELARSIMGWMENETYTYENQTYNLSDSVGCAIYNRGVVVKLYIPEQQASEYKKLTYHGKISYYDFGHDLLESSLNNPTIAMLGDYTLGVYAAMPYGLWVDQSLGNGGSDKRGKGWFSGPGGLKEFAYNEFERIKDEYFGNKQHI